MKIKEHRGVNEVETRMPKYKPAFLSLCHQNYLPVHLLISTEHARQIILSDQFY